MYTNAPQQDLKTRRARGLTRAKAEPLLVKAVELAKAGQLRAASAALTEACERDPKNQALFRELALFCLQQGNKPRAKLLLQALVSARPDAKGCLCLGELCNEDGQYRDALAWHHKAVTLDPGNGDILGNRHAFTGSYREVQTDCILCGGRQHETIWVGNQSSAALNYGVINPIRVWEKCGSCGFIFANPRPTDDALIRWWDHYGEPKKRGAQWKFLRDDVALSSNLKIARIRLDGMAGHVSGRRLLDVGASVGVFLAVCREGRWRGRGVELMENAVITARSYGLDVVQGDFLAMGVEEEVDTITMWEVIEHVLDPQAFLVKAATLLTRGGLLALSTPNPDGAFARFKSAEWNLWKEPTHVHYFTPDTMTRLLERTGFEPLEIRPSPNMAGSMDVYARKA